MITKYDRITPENISHITGIEVFVFGSNIAGRHGAGAARDAMKWGAEYGKGEGHYGKTYAIPTLDRDLKKLSLFRIEKAIASFILYAKDSPDFIFYVTAVGTGIAGFPVEEIAPMFIKAKPLQNICLPASFWKIIGAPK